MLTKPQSHQDTDLPMNYNRMLIIRIVQIWYSGSSPNGHCRPPSQNSLFLPSHRNSVFLHSRKRPAPVMDTFFASRGFPLTELPLYLCYAHIRLFTTNNSIKTHFHIKSLHLTSFWKELCLDLEEIIIVQILSGMRRKGMRRSEVICLKSIGRVIGNRTNWNHVLRLATYTTGCAWWKRRYRWMKYMAESSVCFCSCAVRIYLILTGYHSSVWDGR